MSDMIARLRVALQLDSAAFSTGAKRAASEVDQLGSRAEKAGMAVGRAGKMIFTAGAAIAGSALVSTLHSIVTEGLAAAKAIQEQAQVANASVESFQKHAAAARSVGIEAEKLSDIYKDVNDKVGEFLQTGGGEMKDFFEKIAPKVGVTADQFKRLSGPEALQLYYNSLQKAGLGQKEMTFYMEAMANDSTKLIPLLRNNGAEMNRLGEAAKNAGIVMDEAMIKKSVEAGKKIDDLSAVIKGKLGVAVAENAEGIGVFADRITALADAALSLLSVLGRLDKSAAWRLITGGVQFATNPLSAIGTLSDAVQQANRGGAAPAPPKNFASPTVGATSRIPGWSITGGKRLTSQTPSTFLPQTTRLGGRQVFQGNLDRSIAAGGASSTDDLDIRMRLTALGASGEQVWRIMERTADTAQASTAIIKRSFADMADDTIGALDRVAGAVRGGGMLNILSSLIGLGTQLGSIGLFGKSVQTSLNTIPARAMGGPVLAGRMHLVGERGPELFVPGASGNIVPNHALGGGSNVYNFRGNLMTPEFWQAIQAADMQAARAGAAGGAARVRQSRRWALG